MKTKFNKILMIMTLVAFIMSASCDDSTKPDNKNNNNNGDEPQITAINPNPTYAGYPITITGSKLGFSEDGAYVEINGKKAVKYIYWSYNMIIAMLPSDASSGKLTVVSGGKTSNAVDVTINIPSTSDAPIIKDFDTEKPFPRKTVGIEGSNFGEGQNGNFVVINGTVVSNYTSWKDKKIVIEVPTGATSGDVYVYVNGQKSNAKNLDIQTDVYILDLGLIPGGKFKMGAEDELTGYSSPAHEVIVSNPFYISKYEITQEIWDKVSTVNHNSYNKGEDNPVERVSWLNVCKFCNSLSKREGFKQVYTISGEIVTADWSANGYRLPTEAEWEWAARAGSEYKYGKGMDGNIGIINNIAWHNENAGNSTHPVGLKEPNANDLYDMLGNVMEWCWDWFDSEYYTTSKDSINPKGPDVDANEGKSLRGGSYTDDKAKTTCTYRWGVQNTQESEFYIGFRVVRNAR